MPLTPRQVQMVEELERLARLRTRVAALAGDGTLTAPQRAAFARALVTLDADIAAYHARAPTEFP